MTAALRLLTMQEAAALLSISKATAIAESLHSGSA